MYNINFLNFISFLQTFFFVFKRIFYKVKNTRTDKYAHVHVFFIFILLYIKHLILITDNSFFVYLLIFNMIYVF